MKLNFAPIDAKEYPVVCADYNYKPCTEHNMRNLLLAECEYLTRLAAFQKELSEKYNPLFSPEDESEENDYKLYEKIHDEVYQDNCDDKFQWLYYT